MGERGGRVEETVAEAVEALDEISHGLGTFRLRAASEAERSGSVDG